MGASSSRVGIGAAADILGVSTSTVRELANRGILTFTTTPGGHRRFDPVRLRAEWDAYTDARATPSAEWTQTHRLAGLEEDKVWRSLRTWLDDRLDPLPDSARTILAYAVTETVASTSSTDPRLTSSRTASNCARVRTAPCRSSTASATAARQSSITARADG